MLPRSFTRWSRSGRYRAQMTGRKLFLDVGAHVGETLAVAQDPRWAFDRIFCFEPAPQCWQRLEDLADGRTQVLRFGLWTSRVNCDLHDPGLIGASIFESKSVSGLKSEVELWDAAEWFRTNVSWNDEVVMKVNCEGAECAVLDHLAESGELSKVDELVVHFDVRKVPELANREAATRVNLAKAGVPYHAAEEILFGRNITEKTRNWLDWYHSSTLRRKRHVILRRAEFGFRTTLYNYRSRYRSQ